MESKPTIPFDHLDLNDPNPRADYIVEYIKENAKRGDPESVLEVSQEFCSKYARRSMDVGPIKGKIVEKIVLEYKPEIMLELGAFWGYSAVRFARLLPTGAKYYSVEIDPHYAKLTEAIVEFAGLADRVQVLQGSAELVIPQLKEKYHVEKVDVVFLDHWKDLYKPDLIRLEDCGLLKKGSVAVADNVIHPGAPQYLEYVRNSTKYQSTFFESTLTYRTDIKDGIEKSVYLG